MKTKQKSQKTEQRWWTVIRLEKQTFCVAGASRTEALSNVANCGGASSIVVVKETAKLAKEQ